MTLPKGFRGLNGQVAVPPYSNGPYAFSESISFDQGAAGAGLVMKKDTQIWYVDSGLSVTGNGLSPVSAFLTLQEAVTVAGDYDTILIMPNSIETIDAAGIAITQDGLKIFGANSSEAHQAAALKCTGTAPMFVVTGNRFEIAGLNLSQRGAYSCIQVGSASVGAVYQTYIHNVNFDGYATATYGVEGYLTTDMVNLTIEDCYFRAHVTAAIRCSGTRTTVRRNTISVAADTIGIMAVDATGDRNYSIYVDNYLFGISGSSTGGIVFTGTPSAGTLMLARNMLSGTWNTTITDVTSGVENYAAGGSGGALINC